MHALIIECWPLQSMLLVDELRHLGFTSFAIATTQDGAVAAACEQRPDFITACVRLSDGSGIEAVKLICATQSIPTIFIVSNLEEAPCSVKGSVIVAKPVKISDLHLAVQQMKFHASEAGLPEAA